MFFDFLLASNAAARLKYWALVVLSLSSYSNSKFWILQHEATRNWRCLNVLPSPGELDAKIGLRSLIHPLFDVIYKFSLCKSNVLPAELSIIERRFIFGCSSC